MRLIKEQIEEVMEPERTRPDFTEVIKPDVKPAFESQPTLPTKEERDKILKELEHIVKLTTPGGKIYFRVNPGLKHVPTESSWISFYEWTPTFIINCADFLKVDVLDLRNDYKERMYFVWSK